MNGKRYKCPSAQLTGQRTLVGLGMKVTQECTYVCVLYIQQKQRASALSALQTYHLHVYSSYIQGITVQDVCCGSLRRDVAML